MRKMLVLLAALVLSAAPAAAQQSGPSAPSGAAALEHTAAPSLFPTTDEVKAQVRAHDNARAQSGAAMGERDFLYLVAAIVVGVVIAAVILD